ncbi:MAG: hypothetical protein JWM04_1562 [Verrucomicrobiales bacterium]|nr:hypothetical protein [Verrucomicrobiales bacterium]
MNGTDSQLLQEYSEMHSDAAFSELARRHVDLVYSAALRMVRDTHLAEDVTQGTFVALAKNAAQLRSEVVLSAWLHRTAQNIAAQTVRTEVRRRVREQEAVAMTDKFAGDGVGDAQWQDVELHLDAALGELSEGDRGAVMLRYFEKKTAREMSAILGVSDEASQKRVARAVERLRESMAKRGVTVGASGIVALVSANAVQAAPMALAGSISTSIALGGFAMTTALSTTTTGKFMTASVVKLILVGLAAVTATGIIGVQHQKIAALAEELSQLRAQVQKSEAANADLMEQSKAKPQRVTQQDDNLNELLQLRNEVGRLRATAKIQEATIAPVIPKPISVISETNLNLQAALRRKLETIRIRKIGSATLPLGEVLNRLKEESQRADPDGKGVSFMLNNHVSSGSPNAVHIDLQAVSIQLPEMTNVPLKDVLDAIAEASNGSAAYTVEAYAIMFRPKDNARH